MTSIHLFKSICTMIYLEGAFDIFIQGTLVFLDG